MAPHQYPPTLSTGLSTERPDKPTDTEVLFEPAVMLRETFREQRDVLTRTHGLTAEQHTQREQGFVDVVKEARLGTDDAKFLYGLVSEADVSSARWEESPDDDGQQQKWNEEGRVRLQALYGDEWHARLEQFKRGLAGMPKFKALGDKLGWPPELLVRGVEHMRKHGVGGFR